MDSPKYLILIYSKYSENCKNLISTISKYNLPFQLVCIDNKEIRQRIKNDKKISINVVPCALIVNNSGTVEKYDGINVYNLVKSMVPPPPQPIQQPIPQPIPQPPPQQVQQEMEPQPTYTRQKQVRYVPVEIEPEPEEEEEAPEDVEAEFMQPDREMKYTARDKKQTGSISASLMEEREVIEKSLVKQRPPPRNKNVQPKKQMLQDEGNYVEDEDLYQGDQPETRVTPKKNIKKRTKVPQTNSDPHSTLSRSEKLRLEREQIEQTIMPAAGRPNNRRP